MTEPSPYWIGVDRDELREECQTLATGGGLLSVVGDKASGRLQAAEIATSVFRDCGLRTLLVPDAGDRMGDIRYVINRVIDWASTSPEVSGLSARASNASVSIGKLVGYCADEIAGLLGQSSPGAPASSGIAVVITALWQDSPPLREELRYLIRIKEAGGAWVVIGQDDAIWERNQVKRVRLANFDRRQVSSTLQQLLANCGVDVAHVDSYLDTIFGFTAAEIAPMTAYARLQALEEDLAKVGG